MHLLLNLMKALDDTWVAYVGIWISFNFDNNEFQLTKKKKKGNQEGQTKGEKKKLELLYRILS